MVGEQARFGSFPFDNTTRERGLSLTQQQAPQERTMQNAPSNKYSEIVEQCKQALTIIILNADIIGTGEGLSPEGKKCLQAIKEQAWRINRELKKGERSKMKQEQKQIKAFLEAVRTENNAIAKRLASIIAIVKSMRAGQLGIDIMLTDLEENIK